MLKPGILSCNLNTVNTEPDSEYNANDKYYNYARLNGHRRTYLANVKMGYLLPAPSANDIELVKYNRLNSPSTAIFILCGYWKALRNGSSGVTYLQAIKDSTLFPCHNKSYNILFGDGHVGESTFSYIESISFPNRRDNINRWY